MSSFCTEKSRQIYSASMLTTLTLPSLGIQTCTGEKSYSHNHGGLSPALIDTLPSDDSILSDKLSDVIDIYSSGPGYDAKLHPAVTLNMSVGM